jgi:hypothetical protein
MPRKLPFPQKAALPTTTTRQDGTWQVGFIPSAGMYGSKAGAGDSLAYPPQSPMWEGLAAK